MSRAWCVDIVPLGFLDWGPSLGTTRNKGCVGGRAPTTNTHNSQLKLKPLCGVCRCRLNYYTSNVVERMFKPKTGTARLEAETVAVGLRCKGPGRWTRLWTSGFFFAERETNKGEPGCWFV